MCLDTQHEAFEALIHIDAIISKAAMIDEAKRLAEIERRLYEVSVREFTRRAKKAQAWLVKSIRAGKAKDEVALSKLLDKFDDFFKDLPKALEPFYESAVEEGYRAGFEAIWKKAVGTYDLKTDISYPSPHRFDSVSPEWDERKKAATDAALIPSFSVVDKNAIETLKKHQVFWVGHHYDAELSNTIGNSVADSMIEAGFDRADGAVLVQDKLDKILPARPGAFTAATIIPHGWRGSASQYYEGLAANTMTVSRTFGAMSALRRLGAQTYEISNPMDERTCDVCSFFDGTTYTVDDGSEQMDKVLGTKNPELVKKFAKWDTLKNIKSNTGVKTAGPGASKGDAHKLASSGFAMPPFHFRCRCVVDIGTDTTFGTPQFLPEALPKPVDPLRFKGDLNAMKIVPKPLDGAHKKYLLADKKGEQWLFKPYHANEEYRAYGDVAAARVAQSIGHPTAEVFVTEYKGQFGSVQKWVKGAKGNFKGRDLSNLSRDELRAIQKEHAFDWLISNHDGHAGNLLTLADDSVLGIDKGQLFKFFPKDSIHWTWNPNKEFGEFSIYNKLLSQYSNGQLGKLKLLDLRDKKLRAFFKAIDDLDDGTYEQIIKSYASKRAQVHPNFNEEIFLKQAVNRKKQLRQDMVSIWKEAEKGKKALIPKIAPEGAKPLSTVSKNAITPINKKFISQVKKSKWKGKSLMVAGDGVRDGNLLVYSMGDDAVIIEGRLTSVGDNIAAKLTQQGSIDTLKQIPAISDLRREIKAQAEMIYNKYGTAAVPAKYQEETFKAVKTLLDKVRNTEAQWGYGELKEYKAMIRQWWNSSTKSFNEGPLKSAATKIFPLSNIEKLGETSGTSAYRMIHTPPVSFKGALPVINEAKGISRSFTGIEFELKPGVTFRYMPANRNTYLYSAGNKMQIQINKSVKNLKPEDIKEVFEELTERGLKISIADKDALEYQFLKSFFERQYPNRNIIPNWEAMTFKDKLSILRQEAKSIAKTKINPNPSYTWGDTGWAKWKRFDIAADVQRELKEKFVFQHALYKDDGFKFLKKIASKKTPGLISTEEKYRIGVVPRGMSPGSDQSSGGARMAFGRIRSADKIAKHKKALYFEVDEALTSHSYSYSGDTFGNIHPDHIIANAVDAKDFVPKWSRFARIGAHDETIIENGISIGKLKQVAVLHEQRDEAIKILQKLEKQGVVFDNPIESIVVTTY